MSQERDMLRFICFRLATCATSRTGWRCSCSPAMLNAVTKDLLSRDIPWLIPLVIRGPINPDAISQTCSSSTNSRSSLIYTIECDVKFVASELNANDGFATSMSAKCKSYAAFGRRSLRDTTSAQVCWHLDSGFSHPQIKLVAAAEQRI